MAVRAIRPLLSGAKALMMARGDAGLRCGGLRRQWRVGLRWGSGRSMSCRYQPRPHHSSESACARRWRRFQEHSRWGQGERSANTTRVRSSPVHRAASSRTATAAQENLLPHWRVNTPPDMAPCPRADVSGGAVLGPPSPLEFPPSSRPAHRASRRVSAPKEMMMPPAGCRAPPDVAAPVLAGQCSTASHASGPN